MQEIQRIITATNDAFADFTVTEDNEMTRRSVGLAVAALLGDLARLDWRAENLDQKEN
jgi:hypothetical protein